MINVFASIGEISRHAISFMAFCDTLGTRYLVMQCRSRDALDEL